MYLSWLKKHTNTISITLSNTIRMPYNIKSDRGAPTFLVLFGISSDKKYLYIPIDLILLFKTLGIRSTKSIIFLVFHISKHLNIGSRLSEFFCLNPLIKVDNKRGGSLGLINIKILSNNLPQHFTKITWDKYIVNWFNIFFCRDDKSLSKTNPFWSSYPML